MRRRVNGGRHGAGSGPTELPAPPFSPLQTTKAGAAARGRVGKAAPVLRSGSGSGSGPATSGVNETTAARSQARTRAPSPARVRGSGGGADDGENPLEAAGRLARQLDDDLHAMAGDGGGRTRLNHNDHNGPRGATGTLAGPHSSGATPTDSSDAGRRHARLTLAVRPSSRRHKRGGDSSTVADADADADAAATAAMGSGDGAQLAPGSAPGDPEPDAKRGGAYGHRTSKMLVREYRVRKARQRLAIDVRVVAEVTRGPVFESDRDRERLEDALKLCSTLNFRGANIGMAGATRLAGPLRDNLTVHTLVVAGNTIADAGCAQLCSALAGNTTVTALDCGSNLLTEEAGATLGALLTATSVLRALDASRQLLRDAGVTALARGIRRNRTGATAPLRHLQLASTMAGPLAAKAVASVVASRRGRLATLDLSSNRMGEDGTEALALALAKTTALRKLNVTANGFAARGGAALAVALAHQESLTDLDVARNACGQELVPALLTNRWLQRLNLSTTGLGDHGATALANALLANDDSGLQTMVLASNGVSDLGCVQLARLLRASTVLLDLDMTGNVSTDKGASAFGAALRLNTTLQSLNLAHNLVTPDGALVVVQSVLANPQTAVRALEGLALRSCVRALKLPSEMESWTSHNILLHIMEGLRVGCPGIRERLLYDKEYVVAGARGGGKADITEARAMLPSVALRRGTGGRRALSMSPLFHKLRSSWVKSREHPYGWHWVGQEETLRALARAVPSTGLVFRPPVAVGAGVGGGGGSAAAAAAVAGATSAAFVPSTSCAAILCVGAPGSGKTSVARHLAAALKHEYIALDGASLEVEGDLAVLEGREVQVPDDASVNEDGGNGDSGGGGGGGVEVPSLRLPGSGEGRRLRHSRGDDDDFGEDDHRHHDRDDDGGDGGDGDGDGGGYDAKSRIWSESSGYSRLAGDAAVYDSGLSDATSAPHAASVNLSPGRRARGQHLRPMPTAPRHTLSHSQMDTHAANTRLDRRAGAEQLWASGSTVTSTGSRSSVDGGRGRDRDYAGFGGFRDHDTLSMTTDGTGDGDEDDYDDDGDTDAMSTGTGTTATGYSGGGGGGGVPGGARLKAQYGWRERREPSHTRRGGGVDDDDNEHVGHGGGGGRKGGRRGMGKKGKDKGKASGTPTADFPLVRRLKAVFARRRGAVVLIDRADLMCAEVSDALADIVSCGKMRHHHLVRVRVPAEEPAMGHVGAPEGGRDGAEDGGGGGGGGDVHNGDDATATATAEVAAAAAPPLAPSPSAAANRAAPAIRTRQVLRTDEVDCGGRVIFVFTANTDATDASHLVSDADIAPEKDYAAMTPVEETLARRKRHVLEHLVVERALSLRQAGFREPDVYEAIERLVTRDLLVAGGYVRPTLAGCMAVCHFLPHLSGDLEVLLQAGMEEARAALRRRFKLNLTWKLNFVASFVWQYVRAETAAVAGDMFPWRAFRGDELVGQVAGALGAAMVTDRLECDKCDSQAGGGGHGGGGGLSRCQHACVHPGNTVCIYHDGFRLRIHAWMRSGAPSTADSYGPAATTAGAGLFGLPSHPASGVSLLEIGERPDDGSDGEGGGHGGGGGGGGGGVPAGGPVGVAGAARVPVVVAGGRTALPRGAVEPAGRRMLWSLDADDTTTPSSAGVGGGGSGGGGGANAGDGMVMVPVVDRDLQAKLRAERGSTALVGTRAQAARVAAPTGGGGSGAGVSAGAPPLTHVLVRAGTELSMFASPVQGPAMPRPMRANGSAVNADGVDVAGGDFGTADGSVLRLQPSTASRSRGADAAARTAADAVTDVAAGALTEATAAAVVLTGAAAVQEAEEARMAGAPTRQARRWTREAGELRLDDFRFGEAAVAGAGGADDAAVKGSESGSDRGGGAGEWAAAGRYAYAGGGDHSGGGGSGGGDAGSGSAAYDISGARDPGSYSVGRATGTGYSHGKGDGDNDGVAVTIGGTESVPGGRRSVGTAVVGSSVTGASGYDNEAANDASGGHAGRGVRGVGARVFSGDHDDTAVHVGVGLNMGADADAGAPDVPGLHLPVPRRNRRDPHATLAGQSGRGGGAQAVTVHRDVASEQRERAPPADDMQTGAFPGPPRRQSLRLSSPDTHSFAGSRADRDGDSAAIVKGSAGGALSAESIKDSDEADSEAAAQARAQAEAAAFIGPAARPDGWRGDDDSDPGDDSEPEDVSFTSAAAIDSEAAEAPTVGAAVQAPESSTSGAADADVAAKSKVPGKASATGVPAVLMQARDRDTAAATATAPSESTAAAAAGIDTSAAEAVGKAALPAEAATNSSGGSSAKSSTADGATPGLTAGGAWVPPSPDEMVVLGDADVTPIPAGTAITPLEGGGFFLSPPP